MNMNEETVCGFKVTEQRKRIWACQLEMLKLFHDVCEKHHLKYGLAGGSLIGAIRHNGYIPWDDDIDVVMKRDDYEAFLEMFGEEFDKNKYFLSSSRTERLYPNGHAQIRNINTTQFIKSDYRNLKLGKNCGVFIDIFPLDQAKSENDPNQKKIRKLKRRVGLYIWRKSKNKFKAFLKGGYLFVFCRNEAKAEKLIRKIDFYAQKNNGKSDSVYDKLGAIAFVPCNPKLLFPFHDHDAFVLHKFEDYEFYIPVGYDQTLRVQYGDYMELPKDKGNGSMHGLCYFDLDNSYEKYKNCTEAEFNKLFDNINY